MKKLFNILLVSMTLSCSIRKPGLQAKNRLEILKIDSTKYLYVFNTKNYQNASVIVIAEKENFKECHAFKKYIIIDSIKETGMIKAGSRYDLIGENSFTINGIKINERGELAKIIQSCNAFINH